MNRPMVKFDFRPTKIEERYDLQLVLMDDGKIEESRRRLYRTQGISFDGPRLESINVEKAHFGPNSIIGPEVQPYYIYRLVGQEELFGQAVVVIEAFPRWGACSYLNPGRIWVRSQDGAVLRIERSYQLEKNRDKVRLRGLIMNLDPRLTFISEFAFEKNGVRYPSRIEVRESYFSGEEEKLARAIVESTFSDYRFFGVSSEVTSEKKGS